MNNQKEIFDTIIIGAGPAGFTAAIYAARREMKTMILTKDMGGQVMWASEVENYPGFKSIQNYELIQKWQEHVKANNVDIKTAEVKKIEKNDDGLFVLNTSKETFYAKTVIAAMGLSPRRLAITGEEEFTGKGVSYCANCDGPFYRDKTVVVVGGGNAALDAAEILSKIAKNVYLVHRSQQFRAFEVLVNEVKERENIELILDSDIKEIIGKEKVEKIKVINNQTQEEREVDTDGVFIEIGRIAHTDLVKDIAERDERNQILVDEKCQTSTEGLFAAGDVTQVLFKQITIACGQATIAALAAYQYIQLKAGKEATVVLDRSVKK